MLRGVIKTAAVRRVAMTVGSRTAVFTMAGSANQRHRSWDGSHRSDAWGMSMVGGAAATAAAITGTTLALADEPKKIDYDIVRNDIVDILDEEDYDDGSYGPLLVRLGWHTSGTFDKKSNTGGSEGCTIRFRPERDHGANAGLDIAMKRLEPIKKKHPDISYADLYTLAAVVSIEEMGGPEIKWRPGRSDKPSGAFCTPDGRLPDAKQGEGHLRDIFYRMGFNDRDIVALCGAHAIGRCHTDRSGFKGPWTRAPTTFSNEYFRLLVEEKWTKKNWDGPEQFEDPSGDLMMLPTDVCLAKDPKFREWVVKYANDEELFRKDFAKAFAKLMELGVPFPKSWWRRLLGL